MTDTHNHGERPRFEERMARLCGESTYRVPASGRSTMDKPIPAAHMIAAALAFARNGNDDIGPDVAYDIVTGRAGHATRVTRLLAEALGRDKDRLVKRNRLWLRAIAYAAYDWAVHNTDRPTVQRPPDVTADDWIVLVDASRRILWTLADEAMLRAERAMSRRAA